LLGTQKDLAPYYTHADVFALFSQHEGCPTVVMEALTCGCPVIMTEVNGADELIDPGRTGLIVRDNPGAIAEGLAHIVLDQELRSRLRATLASWPVLDEELMRPTRLFEAITSIDTERATPRVTILIPTHNQERFIDRAIESALSQDAPSLEVVVLDDAST